MSFAEKTANCFLQPFSLPASQIFWPPVLGSFQRGMRTTEAREPRIFERKLLRNSCGWESLPWEIESGKTRVSEVKSAPDGGVFGDQGQPLGKGEQ